MKLIIAATIYVGLLIAQVDEKYEDLLVVKANTFAHEYEQWAHLKNNLIAAKGRNPKEKGQWAIVEKRFAELALLVNSK